MHADRYLTDPLTGLASRRGLEQRLDACFAARGASATLLHLEIDALDCIAQEHGDGEADALQRAVAAALQRRVRGNDCVARLDDGAFVVACVDADPAVTELLARRLEAAVVGARRLAADRRSLLRCTASTGLTRACSTRERCAGFLQTLDGVRAAAQDGGARRQRLDAAHRRFAASVS